MLFWQRKSTHKKIILWAKLTAFSSVIHALFLIWFFFLFKDRSSRLSFVVTPDLFNREIQFTIAPQPKPKIAKKVQAPRKVVPKKKNITKQTSLQKKVPVKKTTVPKKTVPVEKAAPKKTATAPKPKVVQEKPLVPEQANYQLDVRQIGVRERGLLAEFKLLHEEIVSQWAPPPGIAADCSCQVTMLIDWKGAINKFTINESSGVLMYDTAAQKALTMITMPRWTWGKELTITFNQ